MINFQGKHFTILLQNSITIVGNIQIKSYHFGKIKSLIHELKKAAEEKNVSLCEKEEAKKEEKKMVKREAQVVDDEDEEEEESTQAYDEEDDEEDSSFTSCEEDEDEEEEESTQAHPIDTITLEQEKGNETAL